MNRVIGSKTNGDVIYDDSEAIETDTQTTSGTVYSRFEITTLPQLIKKIVIGDTIVTSYSISLWSARAS